MINGLDVGYLRYEPILMSAKFSGTGKRESKLPDVVDIWTVKINWKKMYKSDNNSVLWR